MPFEEAWPWEDLVMATKVYIDMVRGKGGMDSFSTIIIILDPFSGEGALIKRLSSDFSGANNYY